MGGQYWFPSMTIPEIMNALSDWQLSASHEQLVRPSPDFVTAIYFACLDQVTDLNHHSLHDPAHDALNSLEDPNPDLYAAPLSHSILLHHMTRFAASARIPDFSAKDLSAPDPDRTRSILSAFINFIKFTEQCGPFVSRLREKSTKAMDEREAVSLEFTELETKLQDLKAQMALDQPRCEELKKENAGLTAHLMATKEMQGALVKDIETLKKEKAAVLQRKESLNTETVMSTESISRTRSRIVQSPERIKRTIVTMGTTAIEDKRTVALHEGKARDLQAKVTALFNIEKDIRSCVEQLQTIEKEVLSLETSQKELADLKDQLDDKKIERSELKMKQDRVHKQLQNAQDKLERAQKHAEDKRLASQQTIERLQREYEEMALERKDNDDQMEKLRMEADDVAAKMAEHQKKSEAELNELLTEYWKLRHETEVYMEILANKLKLKVSAE